MRDSKAKRIFLCGSLASIVIIVIMTVLALKKQVRFEYTRPEFGKIGEYIDELDSSMTCVNEEEYRKEYDELNRMLNEVFTESRLLMINMNNDVSSKELLDEYEVFYSDYTENMQSI